MSLRQEPAALPRESTLISRRNFRQFAEVKHRPGKDDGSNLLQHLEPFNEEENNSARSRRMILIGPSSVDYNRGAPGNKTKCHPRETNQIFRNRLPSGNPSDKCFLAEKNITCTQSKSLPRNPSAAPCAVWSAAILSSNMRPSWSRMWMRQPSSQFYPKRCIFGRRVTGLAPELGGTSRRRRLRRDYRVTVEACRSIWFGAINDVNTNFSAESTLPFGH